MAMKLELGQLVKSKQGRDKGELFFVVGILDNHHVMLANGSTRKINKPKKKKNKHLMVYKFKNNDIIDKLNKKTIDDFFIKKSLGPFNIDKGSTRTGGSST